MPVLIQKERNSRWLNLSVFLILIAIMAIDLSAYVKPTTDSARQESRVAEIIEAWLNEQKDGRDGLQFWASGETVEPIWFHSVRSWKTIHVEPFDHALVEVDSLSQGGDLVTKIWKISFGLSRDGAPLITRVVDAADESLPPPFLAQRQEGPPSRKLRREQEEAERKMRREQEEAEAKLRALSLRIRELEAETNRRLGRLGDSLDREKQEAGRRHAEHVDWFKRMATEITKTQRDLVAANGQAGPNRGVDPPQVLRGVHGVRIAGMRIIGGAAGVNNPAAGRARPPWVPPGPAPAETVMPNDPQAYLARSRAHLAKGATDLALSDVAEALQLDPTLAEAQLVRAEAFDRKGKHAQANAERSEALNAFYRRGVASIMTSHFEPGIADLEAVIRTAPDHAEAHAWCAKAHYLRSDYRNAIREFSNVIALKPDDKQSYNDRGMAYFHASAYAAALNDFDRAIELDPKFRDAYLNRGTLRLAQGDAEEAAADLSLAIQLDPRNAGAYRMRSLAYERMGSAEKAASDRNLALSLGR